MTALKWMKREAVIAFHDMTIATHGGKSGLRDSGGLDAVLDRARNLAAYGDPDLFDLAAAYAFEIAKAHAFVDGNKRTAYITAHTFTLLNGGTFAPAEAEVVVMMNGLASDEVDLPAFTDWLRRNA